MGAYQSNEAGSTRWTSATRAPTGCSRGKGPLEPTGVTIAWEPTSLRAAGLPLSSLDKTAARLPLVVEGELRAQVMGACREALEEEFGGRMDKVEQKERDTELARSTKHASDSTAPVRRASVVPAFQPPKPQQPPGGRGRMSLRGHAELEEQVRVEPVLP